MTRAAVLMALACGLAGTAFAQNGSQGQDSSSNAWNLNSTHKAVVDKTKGIYKDGKTASGINGGMRPEEQAEILSTMFEGQNTDIRKIITPQASGSKAASASGPAAAGYLDRLSLSNLTGYSPEIQALQSRLNAQASGIPGAPSLKETGKLDYETLSYPRYVFRYDLSQMETRLNAERVAAGGAPSASASVTKRAQVLAHAESAVASFEQAAKAAQRPRGITVSLLRSLSAKQKEASRWISEAALLQEKSRAMERQGAFSPALHALILSAPADDGLKSAYIERGNSFLSALRQIASEDGRAAQLLESKSWEASLPSVAKIESSNAAMNASLSRYLPDYVRTPYLLDSVSKQSSPPGLWNKISAWFFPSGSQAQSASRQRADQLLQAFKDIAAGNFEAAHAVLTAAAAPSEP
ncbi:MAG: hypothetical protein KGL04_06915 [Elusimicrobia bacterium]|nr:hypothetical protein [Elusimicrobiota bacterium]